MALRTKIINGKRYYYLDISYFVLNKTKTFSKYVGQRKPLQDDLEKIEHRFKSEIVSKLSGKSYGNTLISKDAVIKSLLFCEAFSRVFNSLSYAKRRKYETDSTILFTLTTLTTEGVDVGLQDVLNAFEKSGKLNVRERVSRNMLKAVGSIKKGRKLDKKYLLELHKIIMPGFEEKTPGRLRKRQVYLHIQDTRNPFGKEIGYRPPHYKKLDKLIDEFIGWYNSSKLNPIEKAALTHYRLYRIHPFLDGNKRVCRLVLNKALLDQGFPLLNISVKKEHYFQSLIDSVEKDTPKKLAEFTLKEFFRQTKDFLRMHKA